MLEIIKIPIQGTMMLPTPHLAYFWCIPALTATSVPPVVLRKGPELLEVEAQSLRWAMPDSWGAQESEKEGEGIGDGWTYSLTFKAAGQQVQAKGRVQLSRELVSQSQVFRVEGEPAVLHGGEPRGRLSGDMLGL